jgi:hypothetical protein
MTSCQKKDTPSLKNSEITSIETGNKELSITLLEDNFHLVIIESEENILNSIKENIEKTEALGLTEDKKLEEGEVALIGTIAASFSVALGAIVGLSVHKSLQDKKSRESLYAPSPIKQINLRTSLASSPTKMIELPDDVKKSLGLEKNISEKQLAESTLDKLDQGKSLPFESKDAADNVQNLLKEKFPSTEKEMRVIEVNGRFHLVSWQKMFTAEDKPFLVMELSTSFDSASKELNKEVKTKDFIFIVNSNNKKSIDQIKVFKNNKKDAEVSITEISGHNLDGKQVYVFTNKTLQEKLDALKTLTKSRKPLDLKEIDNPTQTQFKGLINEVCNTRKKQLEGMEKVENTLSEYIKEFPNDTGISKLLNTSKEIKKALQRNLDAFSKESADGNIKSLEQKHIKTFQQNFLDTKLIRLYGDYTKLKENILDKLDKKNLDNLDKKHRELQKTITEGSRTHIDSDIMQVGFQGLTSVKNPFDKLTSDDIDWSPEILNWAISGRNAIDDFMFYVNKSPD